MKRVTDILLVGSLAASLVVLTGPANAAGAAPAAPAPSLDTSLVNSPIYIQLLGGATLGNTVTYLDYPVPNPLEPDATKVGYAFAATIGATVADGLSVEADVLTTHRDQDGGTSSYPMTSLMANLKYTVALSDVLSLYGAAGLGYVWYGVTDPTGGINLTSGAGYQFILGASAKVSSNVWLVSEVRYEDTFQYNYIPLAIVTVKAPTTSLLAGLKVGF